MKPLELRVSQKANAQVQSARRWLQRLDVRSEQRFVSRLEALLTKLSEELPQTIAASRPPQLDPHASLGLTRPVFQVQFYTSAKKPPRRSNASTWRVFYALLDTDGDQQPDVLEVLRVFHAAAELPWDRIESLEQEDSIGGTRYNSA